MTNVRPEKPAYSDNTLGVLECEGGRLAFIDNSICVVGDEAHGVHGALRHFEMFGTTGSVR